MKQKLQYLLVDRERLAAHLAEQEILAAEASDGTHIYRCRRGAQESLVIALANGQGLIVSGESAAPLDRRRPPR
ncbi:hypothetical protein DFR40_1312 [Azonexus fungiphilus]|uniref:Uncharacterized protein n=1 Tax=Azonexus fungiphilus TaxID=146940 RepID=A0A495WF76_9RHOO|nr:hypothetical protein [Azonexus fungiphilus]NHC06100.1 hypothetical protein [Azonexus fungiphilus]RKT59425.1 hypothetical protein DFR40_1312 [Azonexus fungiphilus]